MKEVSLLMCKGSIYFLMLNVYYHCLKKKKRYFVGFEKILSGWDVLSPDSSPNILTSSKTASKQGQGFSANV